MKDDKQIFYPDQGHDLCFQFEDHSFWFRQRNDLIQHVVKKLHKPGVFADVGGGNGYVAAGLTNLHPDIEVILIEPGAQGCENARSRGLKKIYQKTLQDLTEYSMVQNIGIFDVIEHIDKDVDFLKELNARLDVGGKLFLTTPAYQFLWSKEDVLADHFRRYSASEIMHKCENAGFEIEFASYFFIVLIPIIFFLRAVPFKLGLYKKSSPENDHANTFLAKIIEKIISFELGLIKAGLRLPFGASLMICARKIS